MDLIVLPASVIVFVLGASVGSFINVVAYRLPARLSILWPPSRCPHCLNQLKAYDNVPVVGWLRLCGRCRYCKSQISVRYPVVEAITAIGFLLVFLNFGVTLFTLGYWAFFSWLLALSLIDLDTMTLPNPLLKSGMVVGIGFQMVLGMLGVANGGAIDRLMMAITGAVLGLWLFDAIALVGSMIFQKTAMGGGDTKLAAMMGAWLGWKYLLLAVFIACCIGVVVGGGAIVLGLRNRKQRIPFGPSLALASVISLFGGEAILSSYIRLFVGH